MAIKFAASDSQFLQQSNAFDYDGAYTALCWFYMESVPSGTPTRIFRVLDSGGTDDHDAIEVVTAIGTTVARARRQNSTSFDTGAISTGTWYAAAIVAPGLASSNNLRFYFSTGIDSGFSLVGTVSPDTVSRNAADTMQVFSGDGLNGRFTNLKVWTGVELSLAELDTERLTYRPQTNLENLYGWWPILAGDTRLQDYGPSGLDWTLQGTGSEVDDASPGISWGALPLLQGSPSPPPLEGAGTISAQSSFSGNMVGTVTASGTISGQSSITGTLAFEPGRDITFPRASYNVVFISPNPGEVLAYIPSTEFVSLRYERMINNISTCTITVDAERSGLIDLIDNPDIIMEVYRLNAGNPRLEKEETYLIRRVEVFEDEAGNEFITFTGFQLLSLLRRRLIVVPDDPTGAGGWSSKAGAATTVINEFVDNQAVNPALNTNRAIEGLTITGTAGIGNQVFERVQYDSLFEVLQRLATKGQVDFKIERTTGINMEFSSGKFGKDLSRSANYPGKPYVLFDVRRGNVITPNYTIDRTDQITYAYAFGQGPEEDREIYETFDAAITESPWGRSEGRTDARSNELGDFEGLILAGKFLLAENSKKEILTFELDEREIRDGYNNRWTIGDTVTGRYHNIERDYRIVSVQVEVNAQGETIGITIAEPDANLADPEIAVVNSRDYEQPLLRIINGVIADVRKQKRRLDSASLMPRSEIAGGRPRTTFANLPTNAKIGMMVWVTDGRKTGETAGNGTGVPAHWDGNDWISDYDGLAVTA